MNKITSPSRPQLDAFRVVLSEPGKPPHGNVVTTIRYDVRQQAKRLPDGAGGWTYNRAGAQAAAYVQLDRWQHSDQFIGRTLHVVEVAL